jgi:hypothetical protein
MVNERVKFAVMVMPCCGQMLCWVNPRMPNYCPECGVPTRMNRFNKQAVIFEDESAWLKHKEQP